MSLMRRTKSRDIPMIFGYLSRYFLGSFAFYCNALVLFCSFVMIVTHTSCITWLLD